MENRSRRSETASGAPASAFGGGAARSIGACRSGLLWALDAASRGSGTKCTRRIVSAKEGAGARAAAPPCGSRRLWALAFVKPSRPSLGPPDGELAAPSLAVTGAPGSRSATSSAGRGATAGPDFWSSLTGGRRADRTGAGTLAPSSASFSSQLCGTGRLPRLSRSSRLPKTGARLQELSAART